MPWLFVLRAPARRFVVFLLQPPCSRSHSRQLNTSRATSGAQRYIFCLFVACAILHAQVPTSRVSQSNQSQIVGVLDQDVSIPAVTGVLGQRDVAALNEIGNHLKVIGAAPWSGMQGTGQITYGIADPMSYSATLSILGSTGFRLDAQTAKGLLSIRIHGRYGVIQDGNGSQSFLFPSTAATGIFQFEMPRLVTFPDPTASLYDHGLGPVGGSILHRITLEYPLNPKAVGLQVRETVATDFYFDPTSHLLLKSANAIRISGAGQSTFLRVITYEDYRQVSGSMIPFRYTQTLNGQKEWTLQLSDVQLNANFNPSIFEF